MDSQPQVAARTTAMRAERANMSEMRLEGGRERREGTLPRTREKESGEEDGGREGSF